MERRADSSDASDAEIGELMVIEPPEVRRTPYTILSRAELAARQLRYISDAVELLGAAPEEVFVLLRRYSWDLSRLQESWFANESQVRDRCELPLSRGASSESFTEAPGSDAAGSLPSSAPALFPSSALSSAPSAPSPPPHSFPLCSPSPPPHSFPLCSPSPTACCPICMSSAATFALRCGHGFCDGCWRGYLLSQVDEGKAAVDTRCPGLVASSASPIGVPAPAKRCRQLVPAELFRKFCDESRAHKYDEWRLRSYVDESSSVKWCTNPAGCQYACEYQGSDALEIPCFCGFVWCWSCGEEAHQPADCKTVQQWTTKNSAETENISWIRANTKKCPSCQKPIEKNQGCNHMVCSKAGGCGHQFCWLCLGEWSGHSTTTGGFYQCNIYDQQQSQEGAFREEELSRLRAKQALDKYMWHFERFMNHDRGMKYTVREEEGLEPKVQALHDAHGFEVVELQFLHDALTQVRACRRVLKWTHVYGFYLEDVGPERHLFDFLLKNLEEKTDRLHEMLEKDFDRIFFSAEAPLAARSPSAHAEFMNFRSHVTNYTNVTHKFAHQILMDLGHPDKLTRFRPFSHSSHSAATAAF